MEVAVSLVPSAVESAQVAERRHRRAATMAPWLVVCCYLLGAVAVTWRLWTDPASHAQAGNPEDVDLFAWFMRYTATAVAHGRLPALVTTAMNAPRGINLMWNTSFLLPGILLTPVTLLAGPQTSLTIMLTLGFAGSAASLFWVLRRWGASISAAAMGGAVYGFSPAILGSAIGHYHMQFAVLPPLIIDALLRIVTGRGNAVRTGAWLGLLTAAQLFIGEELLTLTAVAGVLVVAVLAVGQPGAVAHRVRGTAIGLAAGAGVLLVICGPALWVQFHGPLGQHGSPWKPDDFASHLAGFVTPSGGLLFHTRASAEAAAASPSRLPEYLAYLGWPLLAVLVVAAIRFWRDAKVRASAVTFALLEIFSFGGSSGVFLGLRYPGELLPWHWLERLPVLGEILPDRFAMLADGAAAAVLAFSLDLACSGAPHTAGWRRRSWPSVVAVLAILPLIPLPIQAAPVTPVPAGWRATFAMLRLPPNAPVLVVPVPYSHRPEALRWQASTGDPGSLNGGWFVGPKPGGQAIPEYWGPTNVHKAILELDALWAGSSPGRGSDALIRASLAYLRPAAVVAVTRRGSPLGRFLYGLLGRPTYQVGQVLAWLRPG
jgi:hypothetical protein